MIAYDNRDLWTIFLRQSGSVVASRHVLIPATFSTLLCFLTLILPEARDYSGVSKGTAQIYATIIGFLIVCRTNMAFGRYFQGVYFIQAMFAKWRDAFLEIMVFMEASIVKHFIDAKTSADEVSPEEAAATMERMVDLKVGKAKLLHWFSLLCAVAVHSISHSRAEDTDLTEDLKLAKVHADPRGRLQQAASSDDSGAGEGLHQSSASDAPQSNPADESTSYDRGSMRDEPAPVDADLVRRFSNNVRVLGQVTEKELIDLDAASEPVILVTKWILNEISTCSLSGKMLIEAPILTRVYHELSNGMLAFFRAMQIEAVPFPFPFAQVINYALYLFYILCPFIVREIVEDVIDRPGYLGMDVLWPALVLNFFATASFSALNEIAIELEDPFGDDANDYPITVQQWAVIWAMEESYFSSLPKDEGNNIVYKYLKSSTTPNHIRHEVSKEVSRSQSTGHSGVESDSHAQRGTPRSGPISSSSPRHAATPSSELLTAFSSMWAQVEVLTHDLAALGTEMQADAQGLKQRLAGTRTAITTAQIAAGSMLDL
mmetsp:Transcript_43567/g.79338  ORF Transcript_43567/g.79338 Transcript_43567/m.79338 type:complete len:545 (-) Transcript_43567:34-1668(-)